MEHLPDRRNFLQAAAGLTLLPRLQGAGDPGLNVIGPREGSSDRVRDIRLKSEH
jgi:hypothetical protein